MNRPRLSLAILFALFFVMFLPVMISAAPYGAPAWLQIDL